MGRASRGRAAENRYGSRRRLRLLVGLHLLSLRQHFPHPGHGGEIGRRLPSVRAVAAAAGVHRNTAAAAYRELAAFGLLRSVRGSGTFAVHRPDGRPLSGAGAVCPIPDLAPVVRAELPASVPVRWSWPSAEKSAAETCLLLPLDVAPPAGRSAIPVAPHGPALAAIRGLGPGATVELVSSSRRTALLLRNCLQALRGVQVGLVRIAEPEDGDSDADLRLVGSDWLGRHGTAVPPPGFVPLRLLPCMDAGRRGEVLPGRPYHCRARPLAFRPPSKGTVSR